MYTHTYTHIHTHACVWFPRLLSKESTCNAEASGDMDSIPESGRSPRGGHGNPLQYSCLENPMKRGGWWATVHGVVKSQTWLKQVSTHENEIIKYLWGFSCVKRSYNLLPNDVTIVLFGVTFTCCSHEQPSLGGEARLQAATVTHTSLIDKAAKQRLPVLT